ncbi:MAG: hypothetical protein MI799_06630, partial [Desulfobacterales bacterium]|nr:hypothetical protein [Desulfobacterales bacterium]
MNKGISMLNISVHLKSVLFFLAFITCISAEADVELPKGIFHENIDDLKVKVIGGDITIRRTWYGGRWFFNRAWETLELPAPYESPTGEVVTPHVGQIERNGDRYQLPRGVMESAHNSANNCGVGNISRSLEEMAQCAERAYRNVVGVGVIYYLNGLEAVLPHVDKIIRTDTGYRWFNVAGDWIDYDPKGVIQSYGDRNGATAKFLYDVDGKRSGITDRFDNQVIWYEYDTGGKLRYVRDAENHQIEYRYTGEQLTEVIDVRGYAWNYSYSDEKLISILDPEGRSTDIGYDNTEKVAKVVLSDSTGYALQTSYRYDYDKNKKE